MTNFEDERRKRSVSALIAEADQNFEARERTEAQLTQLRIDHTVLSADYTRERREHAANVTKAYTERNMIVALLVREATAAGRQAWLGWHAGEGWPHDWRNVVYLELPSGQVSWHVHDSELVMFADLPRVVSEEWDGHSYDEKLERMKAEATRVEESTQG